MKKIVIVDDEKGIRDALTGMVEQYVSEATVIGTASGVEEGVRLIQNLEPDILLLDIQMTDGTGFTLLQRLPNINAKIIFITAYDEYALKAIKFNVLEYLLKPVEPEELGNAIRKAAKLVDKENQQIQIENLFQFLEDNKQTSKKLLLKTSESINLVEIRNIIRCESHSNYTYFFFSGGSKLLVSRTLKEYEEILQEYGFFRLHQSHLINLDYFEKYEKKDGGIVVLRDGSKIPVSSRKKEEFLALLEKYPLK